VIRRTLRFGFRLGLLAGIGFALFKLVKGRQGVSEFGSPSADWAPPPAPNPNLPKPVPEPPLITPVELEEIIEKKAAEKAAPPVTEPVAEPEPNPGAEIIALVTDPPAKKAPAKRAPAKKAAAPAADGPVKKVAPKKAPAKKAATPAAAAEAPAAPAKKATKKAAKKAAKKATKAAPAKKAAKKAAPAKKAAKKAAPAKKAAGKKAAKKAAKSAPAKKTAKRASAKKAAASRAEEEEEIGPGLKPGDPAPPFSLAADDGKTYALRDFVGRRVVLYFYPRDNTPGCTTEACDFRDRQPRFATSGVTVLGVSGDSLASHAKFRAKFGLNFPLLTDPGNQVAAAYGAFGEKQMYGRKVQGIIRSTFVIGPDGRLEAVHSPVRVAGHADALLAALPA
jgi:peroxiredoxin Q/BCP